MSSIDLPCARNGVVQPDATSQDIYDGGMVVRREVLGAAHVDRATPTRTNSPTTSRT